MTKFEYISEKGTRLINEDFVLIETLSSNASIYLIADGMGGYQAGDLAAQLVANSIVKHIKENLNSNNSIEEQIQKACEAANEALIHEKELKSIKMGATIGGILIQENSAYCFWLGDVRIIHFRNNKIQFQSTDHTLVNALKNQNIPVSANGYKKIQHVVIKSIQGTPENHIPDIFVINNLYLQDSFIICSDGVHNVLGTKEMELLLESSLDLIAKVKERCEREGRDNYSVVRIGYNFK